MAIIVILDVTSCSLVEISLGKVGNFIQDYVFSHPRSVQPLKKKSVLYC